jgi:hypothetical protein
MFRSISIALAAAGVLAVGALSAVAANAHGSSVSRLATTTALKAEAKGDAVSALASAKSEAKTDVEANDEAADATSDAADEAADTTTSEADNDQQGDAVSAVAKSDATAAHENGAKKVNHGGAVSEAAEKD